MSVALGLLRRGMALLPDPTPTRQRLLAGRSARVDGIPYVMPVNSEPSPVLMAAFPVGHRGARALVPSDELHPLRLLDGRGVLVVTVIDYLATDIGAYIEYSLAIAVTHGLRPAPPLLPLLMQRTLQLGQYVVDLPVSTEVSVKGGKGIWGMPKHQASLDFVTTDTTISAEYEVDGEFGCRIEIDRPPRTRLPLRIGSVNYCSFRGLLYKSSIFFQGTTDIAVGKAARARIRFGDLPQVAGLKALDLSPDPLFTVSIPDSHGVLDDHFEAWFLTGSPAPPPGGDGLDSVVDLGRSEQWPPPPRRSSSAGRA